PASSRAACRFLLLYPVLAIISRQAFCASLRSSRILFKLSSVAYSSQVPSGLPVVCNIDAITNLPFTLGNHLAKLAESLTFSGNRITSAVTPFFEVAGLQANCIPCKDCTRGDTMSICEMPRSQALHSPHCWFSASIPQLLYLSTTQLCDASIS